MAATQVLGDQLVQDQRGQLVRGEWEFTVDPPTPVTELEACPPLRLQDAAGVPAIERVQKARVELGPGDADAVHRRGRRRDVAA